MPSSCLHVCEIFFLQIFHQILSWLPAALLAQQPGTFEQLCLPPFFQCSFGTRHNFFWCWMVRSSVPHLTFVQCIFGVCLPSNGVAIGFWTFSRKHFRSQMTKIWSSPFALMSAIEGWFDLPLWLADVLSKFFLVENLRTLISVDIFFLVLFFLNCIERVWVLIYCFRPLFDSFEKEKNI